MAAYWNIYIAITLVCSLVVTRLAMPLLLRLCQRKGLYDVPDERKIHHTNNIPRLGGMLFVPSMLIGASASLAMMVGLEGREFLLSRPDFYVGVDGHVYTLSHWYTG